MTIINHSILSPFNLPSKYHPPHTFCSLPTLLEKHDTPEGAQPVLLDDEGLNFSSASYSCMTWTSY